MTQLDVDQANHISEVIFTLQCTLAAMEDDLETLCREHPQLVELNPILLTQMRQNWDNDGSDEPRDPRDLFRGEF